MKMGTPWLDEPLSETYRAYECTLNDTNFCAYQQGYWRFWYEADHRYALPTVAIFMVTIILFALGNFYNQIASQSMKCSKLSQTTVALSRFLSYRSFRIDALNWNSAPVGVLALGAVGAIYFFCMTLAPKPYYWPDTAEFGHSPPIATRTAWLSLACMPFVFATAGKSNLITLVTAVSHERLQVFHRWIAYAFFITALVHTFPFIVYGIKTGTMQSSWDTSIFYWTGVVALLAQAWLTFASFGPLRTLSYEWFKFSHFVAALVFVLFLFFHCDHTLSSWDYFIATGVLFALSWLHRQTRIYFEHGLRLRAKIGMAPNGFVCVRIPTIATWTIGQHFFVRFLGLGVHALTNHPFTACSLPVAGSTSKKIESELIFYIRPCGLTTSRLAQFAQSQPGGTMRVMLDGPYGGIKMQKILSYRHQLIVAGGSGAGWVLSLIEAFLLRQRSMADHERIGSTELRANVVLATRDAGTPQWFQVALSDLFAKHDLDRLPEGLRIALHYTGTIESSPVLCVDDVEKTAQVNTTSSQSDGSSERTKLSMQHLDCRPDLPGILRTEVMSSATGKLGVFVCGPLSMQHDVANSVAAEQIEGIKTGSRDVYVHMEHFSWA